MDGGQKMLISKHRERKLRRKRRLKDWWFKITIYRKVRKKLIKYLYEARYYEGVDTNQIFVTPADFKYSTEEVEKALKLLVKKGELNQIIPKKEQNLDGYLVVIATENRSQNRISRAVPIEIDLNTIETKPVLQNQPEETTTKQQTTSAPNIAEQTTEDISKPF